MSWLDDAIRYAGLLERPPDPDPLVQRDPGFIAEEIDRLERLLKAWYAPDVQGLELVPDGRVLCVGMHNGGVMSPDMFITMVAFWRAFGVERAAYGLAHDLVFKVPVAGRWIAKTGGVPARPAHARALLERDAAVLVYPGGDVDAYKPHVRRHVVEFGGRTGFARTAIATGAPILPVVSVGAHEGQMILSDGRELVKRLGLKRLARMEVLPIALALPWGLAVGTPAYLPVPTRVRVRALPVIHHGLPPEAADDAAAVQRLADEVRAVMQAGEDALVGEGGFGPRARAELALAQANPEPARQPQSR
jgi:1-acyl-sn-glycerol-3-phosphate acyltransferase